MDEKSIDNPFRHNYVFSKEDLKRCRIQKAEYLFLWLLPTYVQLADGYTFYFKKFRGKYYLIEIEGALDE